MARVYRLSLLVFLAAILVFGSLACSGKSSSKPLPEDGDTDSSDTQDLDQLDGDTDITEIDSETENETSENDADSEIADVEGDDESENDSDEEANCTCTGISTCCDGCLPRAEGDACSDSVACIEAGHCASGACVGSVKNCDDTNACTTDTCNALACVHTPIPNCRLEDCDNQVDDNNNLAIDCDDATCREEKICKDLPKGDVCADALPVNDGQAVGNALIGQTLTYSGDTTTMHDHYRSLCTADFGTIPDVAYRLQLSNALLVTASHRFLTSGDILYPTLALYTDLCHPDTELTCDSESDTPAEITRVLAPGTYYFIVDGASAEHSDWGAYEFKLSFAAVPSKESDCTDDIDEDQDKATDCLDSDCASDPACGGCALLASLSCGQTLSGNLANADSANHYGFKLAQDANISLTMTMIEGGQYEQLNVNFKEGRANVSCDELYGVSGEVWHTTSPNAAGFAAKANTDYVARIHASNFSSGRYTLSFQCNTEPESACDDGTDNDLDTITDCEDPDCFVSTACSGGHSGESCADPYPVNNGAAIGLTSLIDGSLELSFSNTTENKTNDLSAPCQTATLYGPDAAYRFTLSDTMQVDIALMPRDLIGFQVPALVVFKGSCNAAQASCGETYLVMSTYSAVLPAGDYYVAVDSGAVGVDGRPDAFVYDLSFTFAAPAAPEICDDNTDNNSDAYTDCLDSQCFNDANCTGGASGETCASAYPVNHGTALTLGQTYTVANTTVGRTNDQRASCVLAGFDGPDTVHRFVLSSRAALRATVVFDNGMSPSLALFKAQSCAGGDELECVLGDSDSALVDEVLDAGTYYLVVDSGGSFLTDTMRSAYQLHILAEAPAR